MTKNDIGGEMEQTEDTARTRRTELYEKWLESPAAEAAFEEWVKEMGEREAAAHRRWVAIYHEVNS